MQLSLDNTRVVIRTRNPQKYQIIPSAKIVARDVQGISDVSIRFGLDECRVLKNLGVRNVPSPISTQYSWPGKYKPLDHQRKTAEFFTLHRRAFCFSEAGTAKTMSAAWAADYLMAKGEVRRALVLCPLSIMSSVWVSDLQKSVIHRSVAVAHNSSSDKRKDIIRGEYDFVILNYDGLPLVAETVKQDGRFDLIIVDEANHYKNVRTIRWKTLRSIVSADTKVWMMTGTPAAQSPEDAYGLARIVNPAGVPQFFTAWRDKVMYRASLFKWAPKTGANELVHTALQPAIRYTKKECLDLPPVMTESRDVPLTPQQVKYYNLIKQRKLMESSGEVVSAVNAAALVNKLLQISCGAVYSDTHEVVEFDCSTRLNVLMEVLEETERKVIVFVPYRNSADTISIFLDKHDVKNAQINGDVTPNKRTAIFARFQDERDELRVLVIQPQAASHGVTLTAADTVVFWGPVMSVETYIQAIARTDRLGQTSNSVTVIHLQSSDIERRMFQKLEGRVQDHNLLTGIYEEEMKQMKKTLVIPKRVV